MLSTVISGVCAGIAILMGCSVYLGCESAYVGAILFSVALLSICMKGYALYTGRVGYLGESCDAKAVRALFLGLAGNALATFLLGPVIGYGVPALHEKAAAICAAKLNQSPLSTLIRGCGCGVLMYLAVSVYRDKQTPLGILFCIPVFILSGFEHSIADMGYFAIGGVFSLKMLWFILLVILGNSVGALILPLLTRWGGKLK